MGELGGQTACRKPDGFAGIDRWHFIWLWLVVFLYAGSVISPLLNFGFDSLVNDSLVGNILRIIVFGPPLAAYAIPLFWGFTVLAHDSSWTRRLDNILGPVILIVGWFLAEGITFGWVRLVRFVVAVTGGK